MASVFDVAEYILQKKGLMSAMKLQKLVYYCQAWSLVWDESRLFPERIEAWANGPVVRELFDAHRGQYHVSSVGGNPSRLRIHQKQTIDAVVKYYGKKSPQFLSDLTHMEPPWKLARKGLSESERGSREISLADMEEYYSSLQPDA